MPLNVLAQVRNALSYLNPSEIRQMAETPVRILLQAASPAEAAAMEDYLTPAAMSHAKRMQVAETLLRADDAAATGRFQLVFYQQGTSVPENWVPGKDAFAFVPDRPEVLVRAVLEGRADLGLPLARLFPPFREALAKQTIHNISKENAIFALATALPNILPSLAEAPWAVGEFASDTAVLTVNQIRMAFTLAGASDRDVGYREQRGEIGSIIAGAFGWRTLARELTGKIPFGGGLLPKAAIAYAGTYVVGLSLERFYRVGYGLTRVERREAYDAALVRGREVASGLMARFKPST